MIYLTLKTWLNSDPIKDSLMVENFKCSATKRKYETGHADIFSMSCYHGPYAKYTSKLTTYKTIPNDRHDGWCSAYNPQTGKKDFCKK